MPATNPSTRNVCATSPFMRITVFRYCSGSTRVRSANASSTLSHFGRKRTGAGVSGSGSGARGTSRSSRPCSSRKRRSGSSRSSAALDLGHVHHAPRGDVAARRGAERGEVATEDLGARLDRVVRFRLLDRNEPALGPRAPERRLVVVDHVRAHARGAPGAARLDAAEPVLALEVGERFAVVTGPVRGERAHRRRQALRDGRLPGSSSRSARPAGARSRAA